MILIQMKNSWRTPYHVVLEVENRQCTIVKRFTSLGLKNIKVIDIRSSNPGSIKHLVEFDAEEIKRVKNAPVELRAVQIIDKTKGKPTIWLESEGLQRLQHHPLLRCLLGIGKKHGRLQHHVQFHGSQL